MKNKLGFLRLLGLLGILGIITDNRYFLCSFAFLVFLRYFFVIPDELFMQNVRRAATPAFFTCIGVQAVTLSVTAFTKSNEQLITGFALSFSVSMMLFIILLVIAEFQEQRNR
jgi:hypothetical protein